MQEAENLLQEMSQNFARQLMDLKGNLSQSGLAELAMEVNGLAKQRLVLRYWIQQHHHVLPDENVLECLRLMMTTANTDKQPCIAWSNVEVRVFQGWLTILRQRPPIDSSWQAEWDGKSPLLLPDGSRLVVIADAEENGLKLRVSYRQGGERIFRHGQHQLLKKLMQSEFIPPWQRDVLPLIWRDNQLIAVGGTKLSCDSNRLRFELEKA
jgi:tRNA(Ile)-lysidine synthase